ncbi:MATE family efflux transporter [Senegalia massiliensis]|uniref:Multidrug export protein MepA n=1 Tax=Senegalia massiliensis TaxID=1720316 RepID=A0A845QX88_9CLOT|nr:MATE family efflux transporter [Senegalia massiliensis]NBI06126.1 MATE family efflux transporter [Senegalia massiliensis]
MKNSTDLLKDDIKGLFFKYVSAAVAGMVMNSLYILADTIFIGRWIGPRGLAALNIAIPVFNLLFATALLFGVGGATAISVSLGKKDYDKVNIIFTLSMTFIIGFGLIYTILGSVFLEEISYILGAESTNIELVKDYLRVVFMFGFSFLLVYGMTPLVRNDKAPRLAMMATILGGLTNMIFDWLFIVIFGWGMKGAAIATVFSAFTSIIILLSHFVSGFASLKFTKIKFDFSILKRIIKNGIPSFIIEASSGIVIVSFNLVILSLIGEIGVASYGIIANLSLICVYIFTGLSQGLQPLISINYGAGLYSRVKKIRTMGMLSAFIFGFAFFIVGNLFPEQLISLFTEGSEELITIATRGIRIYFVAFVIMGVNIVIGTYFQSIELSNFSTMITLSRGVVMLLLSLFILSYIFNMNGVWLSVPVAEFTTLLFGVILLKKESYNLK